MLPIAQFIEYSLAFIALYLSIFFFLIFLKHKDDVVVTPKPNPFWKPLISVIIPAYNESNTIKKCISSVLSTNYKNIEIIVVDDGSSDNTSEVVSAMKDSRIKVFKKDNKGKAEALNFGIKKAKGEIIATLDADSYILSDTVEKMLPLFDSDDVAAVTAAVKVLEGKKNFWVNLQKVEYIFTLFSRKIFAFIDAVSVTPGPFSMFRAWVFTEVGYFNKNSILEDQEMALQIQRKNYKIRSSLDAEVFTEVPKNFSELLKQRIRWHRGGLHNTLKYLNMIGPAYGDFGIIVMPLTIFAIIAILAVFFVSIVYSISFSPYFGYYDFFDVAKWFRPIHFIGLCILLLNFIWVFSGLRFFKNSNINALQALIYVVAYSYLLTIFWIAVFIKELKSEKMSW